MVGVLTQPLFDERPHRVARFLLLSLLLHAMWLTLPARHREDDASPWSSLSVHLVEPPATPRTLVETPPAESHQDHLRADSRMADTRRNETPATAEVESANASTPQYPEINLDAALGMARIIGQEQNRQQRLQPIHGGKAPLPLTIESAVAEATKPDVIVESRGAAGEYIVEGKNFRCVTPLIKPHYLEGAAMVPLCSFRKH